MNYKTILIDRICGLLNDCSIETLEAVFSAIRNMTERRNFNERKNHRIAR